MRGTMTKDEFLNKVQLFWRRCAQILIFCECFPEFYKCRIALIDLHTKFKKFKRDLMNNLWMIKAKQLEEDFKLIKTCLYDKHQQKHCVYVKHRFESFLVKLICSL